MPEVIDAFRGQYRWLSNFHEHPVELDGIVYPTTEHAYQAAKTHDDAARREIWMLKKPKDAMIRGRQLAEKLGRRSDWFKAGRDGFQVCVNVMEDLNRQKFSDPELRQKLLDTGDAELIEGNWWGDTFWGVCDGVGENNLGKVLMRIRASI